MSLRLEAASRAFADAGETDNRDDELHLLAIATTSAAIATAAALEELVRWFKLSAIEQNDERQQATYDSRSRERLAMRQ